jgi:hypothetical protein
MANSVALQAAILRAKPFELHRLLVERWGKLASDELVWQQEMPQAVTVMAAAESKIEDNFVQQGGYVHPSIEGLYKYIATLTAMQKSLQKDERQVYAKQFRVQGTSLDQIAGHLWSHYNKPPYVDCLTKLYEGHNLLGEMFQRDAFSRVRQQLDAQFKQAEKLKQIFKQAPPPELKDAPEIKALSEFSGKTADTNLSVEEYKKAIAKLNKEVFNGRHR